jgi:hypothetical protein
MRQIEQDIVNAVRSGVSFQSGTSSSYKPDATGYRDNLTFTGNIFSYKLWSNEIAKGDTSAKEITVSDCRYPTATTTSRLNAIFAGLDIPMAVSIRKKEIVYSYNGHELPDVEKAKGMYGEFNINTGTWQVTIV